MFDCQLTVTEEKEKIIEKTKIFGETTFHRLKYILL